MNFLNFYDEYLDGWMRDESSTDPHKNHCSDCDLVTSIEWKEVKGQDVDKLFEE